MSPADSCGVGMTRFYDCDGIESSARRYGVRSASDPTGPGRLAVGIPLLLHRAGLEPCSGPGGRRSAGSRQAHRHPGAACHGAGRGAAVPSLPRGAGPSPLGRTCRGATAAAYVLDRLLPSGPVVIGIDDTIERVGAHASKRAASIVTRCGPRRDTSSKPVGCAGFFSLMVVVPISWSGRHWALPFLTVLAPSARWSETHRKRHKTLTDWARQAILQTKR